MSAGLLLDTSVPSETLRPVSHPRVTAWVAAQSDIQFVSVVTIGNCDGGTTLLAQGSSAACSWSALSKSKSRSCWGSAFSPLRRLSPGVRGVLDARLQRKEPQTAPRIRRGERYAQLISPYRCGLDDCPPLPRRDRPGRSRWDSDGRMTGRSRTVFRRESPRPHHGRE